MPDPPNEKTLLLPLSHPPKSSHISISPSPSSSTWDVRTKTTKRVAALAALIALVHVSVLWFCADSGQRAIFFSQGNPDIAVEGGGYEVGLPDKITHRWGQYAPWFPADDYTPPPDGCTIDQVHILQRHGARHPNEDDDYAKAVSRLQRAERYTSKKLEFLKDYEYTLGEANLIPLGAQQSWEAGVQAWRRYADVLGLGDGGADEKVFVRASGMPRVVDSAKNWSAGFLSPNHLASLAPPTLPLQILSEDANNTLNDECPGAPSPDPYTNAWLHKFAPPILYRLLSMAQGVRLEEEDVRRLIGMCVFESIAMAGESHGKEKAKSKFCDLFSYEDWKEWEYWGDIEKYYKTGYGNPLGPVQGAGYANELLARLTHSPVHDNTTHNASLPFPLDKRLYVDFTHENLMVAVYSAMGLFRVGKLDPEHRPEDVVSRISAGGGLEREAKTKWRASKMVPFSSRMVVERLRCPARADGAAEGSEDQFVRILVNDALQPLEFCRPHRSSSTSSPTALNTSNPPGPRQAKNKRADWLGKHSLCTLPDFVESQSYAREHAGKDFLECWN